MTVLIRIMFRNLKGYRFLVIFIFIVTFLEVLATANNLVVIKDIFNALGTPPREPSSPFNYLLNWFDPLRPGQKHPTTTIITFALSLLLLIPFDWRRGGGYAYAENGGNIQLVQTANWIPSLNIQYKVGLDGLSEFACDFPLVAPAIQLA